MQQWLKESQEDVLTPSGHVEMMNGLQEAIKGCVGLIWKASTSTQVPRQFSTDPV